MTQGSVRIPEWLGQLKAQAAARFKELHWPTTNDEGWEKTDLGPYLAELNRQPETEALGADLSAQFVGARGDSDPRNQHEYLPNHASALNRFVIAEPVSEAANFSNAAPSENAAAVVSSHAEHPEKSATALLSHDSHSEESAAAISSHDAHSDKSAAALLSHDAHSEKNAAALLSHDAHSEKNAASISSNAEHSDKSFADISPNIARAKNAAAVQDPFQWRGALGNASSLDKKDQAQITQFLTAHMESKIDAWHLSMMSDLCILKIPHKQVFSQALVINLELEAHTHAFPHLVIFAESESRATVTIKVTESAISKSPSANSHSLKSTINNMRVDIDLADAAQLDLVISQKLHVTSIDLSSCSVALGRDSSFHSLDVRLGGGLVVSQFESNQTQPGSEVMLGGLCLCNSGQTCDFRTRQNHAAHNAHSRSNYKTAVMSGGHAVFQGLIEVQPGATGTDAYLANRNLLLGSAARADSIPTLRIGNNDVRASHGSTTGKLREEEIFYLQSRGFSREEASLVLVGGFFEELLGHSQEDVREDALCLIQKKLLKEVTHAA